MENLKNITEPIEELSTTVQKKGLRNVISASFILITFALLSFLFINQREQIEVLKEVAIGIREIRDVENTKEFSKIKIVANSLFDNSKSEVFDALVRIKKENHIQDTAMVREKIYDVLENIHGKRNTSLAVFYYDNKKVSEYTDKIWIDKVANVMTKELYSKNGFNQDRSKENINIVYEKIKQEFFANIMHTKLINE